MGDEKLKTIVYSKSMTRCIYIYTQVYVCIYMYVGYRRGEEGGKYTVLDSLSIRADSASLVADVILCYNQ